MHVSLRLLINKQAVIIESVKISRHLVINSKLFVFGRYLKTIIRFTTKFICLFIVILRRLFIFYL